MLKRAIRSGWKYLLVVLVACATFGTATAVCIARDCICVIRPLTAIEFPNSGAERPVINPATGLLYVSVADALEIAVFDTAELAAGPLARVPTYGYHGGIAVDDQANRIYVVQSFAERVRVIDGETHDYHDIAVPGLVNAIGDVAVDPARRRFYAARSDNLDIAVFDTATEAFLGTIGLGCCDTANFKLAVDPRHGLLWILHGAKPGRLTVWEGGGRRVADIPVGDDPTAIALAPQAQRAYLTNGGSLVVSVIDAAPDSPTAFTVINHITLKEIPNGIAVDPQATRAYTGNGIAGTLSVIDLSLADHVMDVGIGANPYSIALDPVTSRVYLTAQVNKVAVAQGCPMPSRARQEIPRRSAQAAARRATRVALAGPSATPNPTAAAERREFVRCNRMFRIRENCIVGPDVREAALAHATVEAAGGRVVDGGAAGQFCGVEPDNLDTDLAAAGSYYSAPVVEAGADAPVVWTFHSRTRTFGEDAVPADAMVSRVASPPASPWPEALWYLSRRKTGMAPDAECEHLP